MTELMFEKDKVTYVVVKCWREPDGFPSTHFKSGSKLKFANVVKLTATGVQSDHNGGRAELRDPYGNLWMASMTTSGLRYRNWGINPDAAFQQQVFPEELKARYTEELENQRMARFSDFRDEISGLTEAITVIRMMAKHLQNPKTFPWELLSLFIPKHSGITKQSVLDFMQTSAMDEAQLQKLLLEITNQISAITGRSFDDDFMVGHEIIESPTECRVLLDMWSVIPRIPENFNLIYSHRVLNGFWVHLGGLENLFDKTVGRDKSLTFTFKNNDGNSLPARTSYHTHRGLGDDLATFIEINSELTPQKPIRIYLPKTNEPGKGADARAAILRRLAYRAQVLHKIVTSTSNDTTIAEAQKLLDMTFAALYSEDASTEELVRLSTELNDGIEKIIG